MGKGDKVRERSSHVSLEEYGRKFDKAFGKKEKTISDKLKKQVDEINPEEWDENEHFIKTAFFESENEEYWDEESEGENG